MARKRKQVFSTVKAVKANARTKVGQPKPARILAAKPASGARAKYKETLADTLDASSRDL